MNRTDFMKQLESLLQNISPAEREEALQYYNEYFNDAGEENEQNVIEALGNPAKVAENIKRDLYGSGYGDNSYQRPTPSDKAVVKYQQDNGDAEKQSTNATKPEKEKMSTGMIVLIVVLCVLASPVILGIGSGILGTIAGFIVAWFALIVGFGVAAVILLVAMLILVGVGIGCLFTNALAGVGLIGGALLCGGIGVLLLMLTVAMAGIATPAACRGIAALCRSITKKKQAA